MSLILEVIWGSWNKIIPIYSLLHFLSTSQKLWQTKERSNSYIRDIIQWHTLPCTLYTRQSAATSPVLGSTASSPSDNIYLFSKIFLFGRSELKNKSCFPAAHRKIFCSLSHILAFKMLGENCRQEKLVLQLFSRQSLVSMSTQAGNSD